MASSNSSAEATAFTEEDIVSIIVSTDNHLGYMEKDPIRSNDSFLAFEEVLATAKKHNVDLVILSGDMFHENRPSRHTVWRTMEILRKYVMGDNPVKVQLESVYDASRILQAYQSHALQQSGAGSSSAPSAAGNKRKRPDDDDIDANSGRKRPNASAAPSSEGTAARISPFDRVNWEDPNFNIGLPLFTIHGNHDDPSRDGAGGPTSTPLSALDLLAMSNLLNYFGKASDAVGVTMCPILLRKGKTRLALYGLGGMREDLITRAFNDRKIAWKRPSGNADDWFNMLLIHQNREGRAAGKSVWPIEWCLPGFLDMVIWGHEHECKTELAGIAGRREAARDGEDNRVTRIMQPGSTIATSLAEGEAERKHCFLLRIRGFQYQVKPVPLRCVRPFIFKRVALADLAIVKGNEDLAADSAELQEAMKRVLTRIVHEQLSIAEQHLAVRAKEGSEPPPAMKLPLIRVVVDHTGYKALLGLQRFGAQFTGKAANPGEILHFIKQRVVPKRAAEDGGGAGGSSSLPPGLRMPVLPSQLHAVKLEDLVKANLAAARENGKGLRLLGQRALERALVDQVSGLSGRIADTVQQAVEARSREALASARQSGDLASEVVLRLNRERIKDILGQAARDSAAAAEAQDEVKTEEEFLKEADARRMQALLEGKARTAESGDVAASTGAASPAPAARGRGGAASSRAGAAGGSRGGRGRGGKATVAASKRKTAAQRDSDGESDLESVHDEELDDDMAEEARAKPAPVRGGKAARSTPAASGASRAKKAKPAPEPEYDFIDTVAVDVDEIEELDDEEDYVEPARKAGKGRAAAPAPAAGAGAKPASKVVTSARQAPAAANDFVDVNEEMAELEGNPVPAAPAPAPAARPPPSTRPAPQAAAQATSTSRASALAHINLGAATGMPWRK